MIVSPRSSILSFFENLLWFPCLARIPVQSKYKKNRKCALPSLLDWSVTTKGRGWNKKIIDHDFKRATPLEWADYSSAHELLRIFNSGKPSKMFERLLSQSYTVKRPLGIRFYNKSRGTVGAQCFVNRSVAIAKKILFDMSFSTMSSDSIRIALKNRLFIYPTTKTAAFLRVTDISGDLPLPSTQAAPDDHQLSNHGATWI